MLEFVQSLNWLDLLIHGFFVLLFVVVIGILLLLCSTAFEIFRYPSFEDRRDKLPSASTQAKPKQKS